MTIIVDGEVQFNELTKNAKGGTELIIDRMIKYVDPEVMKGWNIIHSRLPEKLDTTRKNMIVFHDLPNDPMYNPLRNKEYMDAIDRFVFVSNWQLQYFNLSMGIPYSKSTVIQNGIEPFEIREDKKPEKIKIIYHTTPHRGLEILIPVFKHITKYHDDIELDVYSSFEIYGWKERDAMYQGLFEDAVRSPQINYHGFAPNNVVREALKEAHIFAYPSIWPETSCLAMIEALSAGLLIVHPNYAALPETAAFRTMMYDWTEDKQQHANRFAVMLNNVINSIKVSDTYNPKEQQAFFNSIYDFKKIAHRWNYVLSDDFQ